MSSGFQLKELYSVSGNVVVFKWKKHHSWNEGKAVWKKKQLQLGAGNVLEPHFHDHRQDQLGGESVTDKDTGQEKWGLRDSLCLVKGVVFCVRGSTTMQMVYEANFKRFTSSRESSSRCIETYQQ